MHRYLFNVGEGFQRFAMQHQISFKHMSDILLTRNSSDAAGGLPGAKQSHKAITTAAASNKS